MKKSTNFYSIVAVIAFIAIGLHSNARTLVAYYSYTGNCRTIVNELTAQLAADVVEITPVDKTQRYEANNYAIGSQLLNAIKANPDDEASYPAIDPVTTDAGNYDNIIIVTPLWWSQMAAIMQTYLFQNRQAMAGKHVALIVSSASSSISGVEADARRLLPDATWMGSSLWINNSNRSRTATLIQDWLPTLNFSQNDMPTLSMNITIGGQTRTVALEDNDATRELIEALQQATITYQADDYGGFEKVGALGRSLTTSNRQITTQPGDVMLYNGNQIVLFYGNNSWSYTPLGHIDYESLDELKAFLHAGQGSVGVTLSLPSSGITTIVDNVEVANGRHDDAYYSITGQRVEHPTHGIYIKNGKKVVL